MNERTHKRENLPVYKNTKRNLKLTTMQRCKNCSRVCVSELLCAVLYTPVVHNTIHNTAQSSSDFLPSNTPDSTRAQMLSVGGEGKISDNI